MNAHVIADEPFLFAGQRSRPDLRSILWAVSVVTEVPLDQLRSRAKTDKVAQSRHMAMYLMRRLTSMSYPRIGAFLGFDHSTIIHGVNAFERRLAKPWQALHLHAQMDEVMDLAVPSQDHEAAWHAVFVALQILSSGLTALEPICPLSSGSNQ